MGVHHSPSIGDYWNTNIERGLLHTIARYISLNRFKQLRRYFHISCSSLIQLKKSQAVKDGLVEDIVVNDILDNSSDIEDNDDDNLTDKLPKAPEDLDGKWWYKLEPLISTFRENCKSHWIPSSNVSVDEMMIRCHGRSIHIVRMPNKPIQQGYKMGALCERGYLSNFMYSSREYGTGELIEDPDLTRIGSMVLQLGRMLPKAKSPYTIYLDHYFTSISLFQKLRDIGIGACGTTRVNTQHFPPMLQAFKNKFGQGSLFYIN